MVVENGQERRYEKYILEMWGTRGDGLPVKNITHPKTS